MSSGLMTATILPIFSRVIGSAAQIIIGLTVLALVITQINEQVPLPIFDVYLETINDFLQHFQELGQEGGLEEIKEILSDLDPDNLSF